MIYFYLGLFGCCFYLGLFGCCFYLGLFGCFYLGLFGCCFYLGLFGCFYLGLFGCCFYLGLFGCCFYLGLLFLFGFIWLLSLLGVSSAAATARCPAGVTEGSLRVTHDFCQLVFAGQDVHDSRGAVQPQSVAVEPQRLHAVRVLQRDTRPVSKHS